MIKRPMCILCVTFVFTMYVILSLLGGVDENEHTKDYTKTEITGIVTHKVYKNKKYSVHVKVTNEGKENSRNNKVIAYIEKEDFDIIKIGQLVYITGTFMNFNIPSNEGEFNMRKYYRIRGYDGFITKGKIERTGIKYSLIRNKLYLIKEKTKRVYFSNMSETEAGTLSAMVLGDKSDLEEDIKSAYQNAGISHILSLSGLHISTVGMCIYALIYSTGVGVTIASFISSIVMISYGIMTGLSTSTLRALIMFILGLIAKNIGRTYDLLSAAYLSIILILFENPYYVYDSGFLLSCFSVFGIGLMYPILDGITEKITKNEFFNGVRQSICISFSTTLFTLPIIMNSFYKTSRYGVFINLVVVPLMGVVLGLGIISGIVGNIFPQSSTCLCEKILLVITEKILILYTYLSEKASNAYENTWVTGRAEIWQCGVYIILLLLACWCFEKDRCNENRACIRKRNISCGVIIVAAVFILSYRRKPDFEINVLSVGQGACNVICGKDTPVIMIDGGSTDEKDVGKYKIRPFLLSKDIDTIDYVFISHPDEDHVSGICELLQNDNMELQIKNIVMSTYDAMIYSLAMEKNIKVYQMHAGQEIRSEKVSIQCLSPNNPITSQVDDINDLSLVLKITYNDFSAIFPGDISSNIERQIVANKKYANSIKQADFLSAPHHGSKYSSCQEFLTTLNPRIITISAGKNNSYGHPHKETLERLNQYAHEAKVLRTDECGQVTVIVDKNVAIRRFLKQ